MEVVDEIDGIDVFFLGQTIVPEFEGYEITPELLRFVSQRPDIGYYKWKGIITFDDNELKHITEEEIQRITTGDTVYIMSMHVSFKMNHDGIVIIGKYSEPHNRHYFVKYPLSQIRKQRESRTFIRQQNRIAEEAEHAGLAGAFARLGMGDENNRERRRVGEYERPGDGGGMPGGKIKRRKTKKRKINKRKTKRRKINKRKTNKKRYS
jgi:hypothetical protein